MSPAPDLAPPGSSSYNSDTMSVGDGTWDSSRNDFLLPNLVGLNFDTMRYNGELTFHSGSYGNPQLTAPRYGQSLSTTSGLPWVDPGTRGHCSHNFPHHRSNGYHDHTIQPYLPRSTNGNKSPCLVSDPHSSTDHGRLRSWMVRCGTI